MLSNMTGCSICVNAGTMIGVAAEVDIVEGDKPVPHDSVLSETLALDEINDGTSIVKKTLGQLVIEKENFRNL